MAGLIKEIIVKPELRPCWVNGEKALFHKWIAEEKAILVSESIFKYDQFRKIKKDFDEYKILAPGCKLGKITQNFALVEFKNGQVKEVDPRDIKFCDSEALLYDYEGS